MEIPAPLIDDLKRNRLVLLIGSGCSRSAGMPSWAELIDDLINSIIINDTHLKNQIKAWRKDKKDYPRIAQALCLLNPQLYHDRMVAKLDPPNHKKAVPYFHVFSQLGISKILTTNFDLLLESALYSKGWRPCNWARAQQQPVFTQPNDISYSW